MTSLVPVLSCIYAACWWCTETAKGCCSAKISAMPVTVIFFIVALIVIGFIISAVLLAIRLQSLLSVSVSYTIPGNWVTLE